MEFIDRTKQGILAVIRLEPGCSPARVNDRLVLGLRQTDVEIEELVNRGLIRKEISNDTIALFVNNREE